MNHTTFSLIVPTRQRTGQLRRFLDSVRATTRNLDELEVILVIDDDDEETNQFQYLGVDVKRVRVPRGFTMGALNMAGYRAATGQYLMLLNDDVVLRTPGWDEQVLAAFRPFPDGIVLIHVNDLVFKDTLCIFPFLPRKFCLLNGGICSESYVRYRIDDHIHNIFDLLSLLGRHRRIYLPDVVFEHTNVTTSEQGVAHYVPDPATHEADTRLFDFFLEERKTIAIQAMCRIDGGNNSDKYTIWKSKLDPVTDSVATRLPEHARWFPTAKSSPGQGPRVTIGIVSADLKSEHAQKCVELVKLYTANYELILIDNNGDPNFNHSREMNRILSICRTDYLVLMDDDVFVEPGWLPGMLRCVGPGVGVVTPLHKDRRGGLSYAGIVMRPDETGHHSHIIEAPSEPQRVQTLCSAIMLIHMPACGHIRLDERYTKYFLDIDYGLHVWEEGYQVVCSPYSEVTHLAGATLEQGGLRSTQLFEEQRQRYEKSWVDSGRIHALRRGAWKAIPEICWINERAGEIDRLLERGATQQRDDFMRDATALVRRLAAYPALKDYIAARALLSIGERQARVDDPKTGHLAFLMGLFVRPVLFEEGFEGMNIVLENSRYYALPQNEGVFSYQRMLRNAYSCSFEADSLEALKSLILRYRGVPTQGHLVQGAADAQDRALASNHRAPPGMDPVSAAEQQVSWEMADLERRLAATELGLAGIYQSRTWKMLTSVGGILESTARMLRRLTRSRRSNSAASYSP